MESVLTSPHLFSLTTPVATDIFDRELNDLRKHRWERAFCSVKGAANQRTKNHENDSDLRATIVIERKLSFCHCSAMTFKVLF